MGPGVIIGINFIKLHKLRLHAKYHSSKPNGFRKRGFKRFYYEKLVSPRAGSYWARGS